MLRIQHGRAVGLGACDVKGAAAALLAAASRTSGPAGLLLTSDEEAGGSTCVRTACASLPRDVEAVIVAEPTGCRAVISHRGLRTCEGAFRGRAGHGSGGVGARNAVHDAARWVDAALRWSDETQGSPGHDGLVGIPLNVGVLDGGVKANIAAPEARVVYGVRPLPGQNGDAVLDELHGLAPREADVSWTARFAAPALVSTAVTRSLAESLDLEVGPAVDFWTEAALFAEAGVPSFVFGPGDIAQAHTADEWIDIEQLERATSTYARFFTAKSG